MSALEAAPTLLPADTKPTPRQLVVLSGKGGTGKTSIVAALAALVYGQGARGL